MATRKATLQSLGAPTMLTAADKSREKRWRAEDDLRALQRAEEILKDAARMREAKKIAQEQMEALQKVVKKK